VCAREHVCKVYRWIFINYNQFTKQKVRNSTQIFENILRLSLFQKIIFYFISHNWRNDDTWLPLERGQRRGLETSANKYQLMLRDNSKERKPQLTVLFSHGKQKFKVHRPWQRILLHRNRHKIVKRFLKIILRQLSLHRCTYTLPALFCLCSKQAEKRNPYFKSPGNAWLKRVPVLSTTYTQVDIQWYTVTVTGSNIEESTSNFE
jgi:hypothetical protein